MADADRHLIVGVEWTLSAVEPSPVDLDPSDYPSEVTMRVSPGHVLSAFDGCNFLSARITDLGSGRLGEPRRRRDRQIGVGLRVAR